MDLLLITVSSDLTELYRVTLNKRAANVDTSDGLFQWFTGLVPRIFLRIWTHLRESHTQGHHPRVIWQQIK